MKAKKQPQKKAQKPKENMVIPRILSMGDIDLIFTFNFDDADLADLGKKFDEIKEAKDLQCFENKENLLTKFELSTTNKPLLTLLYMNKVVKNKCYIDYIPFKAPEYSDDQKFVENIVKYVTDQNFLYLNQAHISEGGRYSWIFNLKYQDQETQIVLGTPIVENEDEEAEEKMNEKKEGSNENADANNEDTKGQDNMENAELQNKDNNQDMQANEGNQNSNENKGDKKLPDFTNKNTPLAKMQFKCSTYDIVYIPFENILSMNDPNFQLQDLVELWVHFKRTSSPLIVINFPDFSRLSKDQMAELNDIFIWCDLFYFNQKDTVSSFQAHYETFTTKEKNLKINNKKVFDYFIKGIATGTREAVIGTKYGIFVDEFAHLTIVEAFDKVANKVTHDCQPYPKVNHANLKLVEEYRELIKKHNKKLLAIFLGGFLSKLGETAANSKCMGIDSLYPPFLTGWEITKKVVEIYKNNMEMPTNPEFYTVKISKTKLEEQMKMASIGNREGGFVLDCLNQQKSSMKDYVALHDYHLKAFFTSSIIRKDLKNKGFINTNGFIMYDPVYRSVMGSLSKNQMKSTTQDEMNKKLISEIKDINVSSNIKKKELDSKTMVLRSSSPTEMKIPIMKESEYLGTMKKTGKSTMKGTKKDTQDMNEKFEEPQEMDEKKKDY